MTRDEGGDDGTGKRERQPLREMEPFVTMRAYPRRFGWGIPLVFGGSFVLGVALVEVDLSLAIAVQLVVQTVGLLWLYVPAARRLRAQERAEWEGRQGKPALREETDGGKNGPTDP